MALLNKHICRGSTEPFMCHTVISTKIKCAGSFDLFLASNQVKLTFFTYEEMIMITIWISIKFTIC